MSENTLPVVHEAGPVEPARPTAALDILRAAVQGGITAENVAVVKEIKQMVREEEAHRAKIAATKALFALRKAMPVLYADKVVKTDSGAVAFEYCSPQEIKDAIEPLLQLHGFCIIARQEMEGESKVTVRLSVLHEQGHEFEGAFTIRVGHENKLVKAPQVVAAAATAAERHALVKFFGLRLRVGEEDDRTLGQHITPDQAKDLKARVEKTKTDEKSFLKYAQAPDYASIYTARYQELSDFLAKRERVQANKQKSQGTGIAADVARALRDRVLATGADWTDFLKPFAVERFEDLPAAKLEEALAKVARLEGKA